MTGLAFMCEQAGCDLAVHALGLEKLQMRSFFLAIWPISGRPAPPNAPLLDLKVHSLEQGPQPTGHIASCAMKSSFILQIHFASDDQDEDQQEGQAENADAQDSKP